jgi:predicted nuclease of predicted toxin-antitoxin system
MFSGTSPKFSPSRLNLQFADDRTVFEAARKANAVIMSKDSDFLKLVEKSGTPPQILWITCGNTTNSRMREVLYNALDKAEELLLSGEPVVEISDKHGDLGKVDL